MSVKTFTKEQQAAGDFGDGKITENKPIGFPQDFGNLQPYSTIFYWANALAVEDCTIGLHHHKGFEILSFNLQGEMLHYDTINKNWEPLKAGEVQHMYTGSGVKHDESMYKNARMLQIWLDPNFEVSLNEKPSYNKYSEDSFPLNSVGNIQIKTLIGTGSPVQLKTKGIFAEQLIIENVVYTKALHENQVFSIYIIKGNFQINNAAVQHDDFIIIEDEDLNIEGSGEVFILTSLKKPSYKTYANRNKK